MNVELNTENGFGLFGSDDEDLLGVDEPAELRSIGSVDSLKYARSTGRAGSRTPSKKRHAGRRNDRSLPRERTVSAPISPGLTIRRPTVSGNLSISTESPTLPSTSTQTTNPPLLRSPLARLFGAPRMLATMSDNMASLNTNMSSLSPSNGNNANVNTAVGNLSASLSEEALAGVRRLEVLVDGIKDLPVQRLKDEMKELQERQARIESLLLTLTRGMRNDLGSTSSRHNSS